MVWAIGVYSIICTRIQGGNLHWMRSTSTFLNLTSIMISQYPELLICSHKATELSVDSYNRTCQILPGFLNPKSNSIFTQKN
jgi:hypothetical protein